MHCTKNPLIHYLQLRFKVDVEPTNQYYARERCFAHFI